MMEQQSYATAEKSMRAARFYAPGEPLKVETVPRPRPVADDDVLVRVTAAGLCGSDIHIAVEGTTPTAYQPVTLGHEIAGTAEDVGGGVEGWTPGDRVSVSALIVDGTCANRRPTRRRRHSTSGARGRGVSLPWSRS